MSGLFVRAAWSVAVTYRRAVNRLWDAAGYAAGYCMATSWQPRRKTFAGLHSHSRCMVRRDAHQSGWHRQGNWRWLEGGEPIYDVPPAGRELGVTPGWLKGRHYPVGRRRWDRERQLFTFEQVRARNGAYAAGVAAMSARQVRDVAAIMRPLREALDRADAAREGLTPGELGTMPFTGPAWSHRPYDDVPLRHDPHFHGIKPGPACTCTQASDTGHDPTCPRAAFARGADPKGDHA